MLPSVGAAGLGLRLAMSVDLVLRVILRAGFAFVLRFFSHRVRDRSWRACDRTRCAAPLHARRSGILISAVLWMVISVVLLFGCVRKPRNAIFSQVG